MALKSIQWKLVVIYILLLLFALELFGVYMLTSIENYYMTDLEEEVHGQVSVLSNLVMRYLMNPSELDGLTLLINEFSPLVGGDIYVLDKNGFVLAASPGLEESIERRLVQNEVVTALLGRPADSVRYKPGTNERHYFYAEPVVSGSSTLGALYVSVSLDLIDNTLSQMRRILVTGAILTLLVSALLGLNLATTITKPLQAITHQAEALKQGDFKQRIDIDAEDEIGRLAYTFNTLARQLELSWDEISQEKDKIEGILTNLSDGLLVFDHQGKVMHINSTACSWFGVNQAKMLKTGTIEDFPVLNQQSGLISLDNGMGLVLRQRRLPFLQSGKKQGTIVVLSDVTEQHRLDLMRQEFVANVSHELRTPLTTIKSYTEALLENPDEDQELRARFMQVIDSETDRMVRMVEDLLVLSRTEAGSEREFLIIPVDEILYQIVDQNRVQAENRGLEISTDIPKHLPLVRGDRDQLHRLFLNLINNAIKYTPGGGSIEVAAESRNNYLEVAVRDTGIGIPREAQTRIFERFYQVDKSRTRKGKGAGTGLGLSIAKQIVEAHGGTITINSEEGRGTEALVTLPIAARKRLPAGGYGRLKQNGED
ncbi:MAG: cell wall metabolism sensor histidine kinase WalK [Firmicutes bacterium]|nr:cell wall metabolism sensor histidine kinase WalK [Bacillota bacterium]